MNTLPPVTGDVVLAFPTPILVQRWANSEALNNALCDLVLAKERSEPGVQRSNSGGWHSEDTLFEWDHSAITELQQRIKEAAFEIIRKTCGEAVKGFNADLRLTGWANVSRDRAYNDPHKHSGSTWSGVYYVSLGKSDPSQRDSGKIEFLDPRMGVESGPLPGNPFGANLQLSPEPGMLLMFPSWLLHWVHPFHGAGERISLAFNVYLSFSRS